VINFASDRYFGLVGKGEKGTEGNEVICRKWETSNSVIPTIHGTSFSGLSILIKN
jgi:hypothetical protein